MKRPSTALNMVCCHVITLTLRASCSYGMAASSEIPAFAHRLPSFFRGGCGRPGPARLHPSTRSFSRAIVSMCDNQAQPPSGFKALNVRDEICTALAEQNILEPNEIQRITIPAIAGGTDVVIGSQTGSGKTLSYLIPVLEKMKQNEEVLGRPHGPGRPRALVLVPTRELAEQVKNVAKTIGHHLKFSSAVIVGGVPSKTQTQRLTGSPLDLLVATPGRMLRHMERGNLKLDYLVSLVIDEVDTMLDAGFMEDIQKILTASSNRSDSLNKVQHISVGATHPPAAESLYNVHFPGAKRLMNQVHMVPSNIRQDWVQVRGSESKTAALQSVMGELKGTGELRGGKVVVFCNTKQSTSFVEHWLQENGYECSFCHGGVEAEQRKENFERFKEGETQVLVCTDLAARGLDNLAIERVINFDFPCTAVDYLHRAGRVGRAGAKGVVTSLVGKRDKQMASLIQQASRTGEDVLVATRNTGAVLSVSKTADPRAMALSKGRLAGKIRRVKEESAALKAAGKGAGGDKKAWRSKSKRRGS